MFFDDILVYSSTWESHLMNLQMVFSILQDHQLYVNRKKCSFGKVSVEYLGRIILEKWVEIDLEEISTIVRWPIPRSIKRE